jgi:hypothetical protein
MELNSEQYERIGRWLDGERVELAPEELAAAQEVRAGESALKAALGEPAFPRRAMARVSRRMQAALAARPAARGRWVGDTPRAVRGRYIGVAAAGAAVAAALILAWAVRLHQPQVPLPPGGGSIPLDEWVRAMEVPPGGDAIHLLAREVDRFEAELAVSWTPPALDWQMDSVQDDINNFWQDDPPWEVPEG